jgi:cephalosporin hydroxylase
MDWHTIIEALGGTAFGGALLWFGKAMRFLGKVETKLAGIAANLADIKDNHLKHLSEDIGKVSDKLDRHVEWHATQGGKK